MSDTDFVDIRLGPAGAKRETDGPYVCTSSIKQWFLTPFSLFLTLATCTRGFSRLLKRSMGSTRLW